MKRFSSPQSVFGGSRVRAEREIPDIPESPPPPYTEVTDSLQPSENHLSPDPSTPPQPSQDAVPSAQTLSRPEFANSVLAKTHFPASPTPEPPTRRPPEPPKETGPPTLSSELSIEHNRPVDRSGLPPSATALLRIETNSNETIPSAASWLMGRRPPNYSPPRYTDPASLELELVCAGCFSIESECDCLSGHATTVLPISEMPWTKKPYGAFPVPEWLAGAIGMRAAHAAAGVASYCWPAMSLGAIPIFDKDSLAFVRSRALDRCPDAREFMLGLVGPITKHETQECSCGCQEAICSRVALRHNLYTSPGALEQARSTTYQIGKGSGLKTTTAVTLGNGITCLSGQEFLLDDIETDFVEDFLLANALDPSWAPHDGHGVRRRSDMMSWDGVVNSWTVNMLLRCKNARNYHPFFWNITTKGYSRHGNGCQFVVRSECLGTGIGVMVLDLPSNALDPQRGALPVVNLSPYKGAHYLPQLDSLQRKGEYYDYNTAPAGQDWDRLAIKMSGLYHPQFEHVSYASKSSHDFSARIGAAGRAKPGFKCTMSCKNGVPAYCCGFMSPNSDTNKTTAYLISSNHSVAFLAVAEYAQELRKQLYLVNQRFCMGCTVLQAPLGSIVAGILPNVTLGEWQDDLKDTGRGSSLPEARSI